MPLQNFQYDTIMREYSRRQAQNHRILEEHTAEAYGKIPRLKEIDDEVATLSADKVRRLLNGEEKGTSDLKAAIQELSDERITLLVAGGLSVLTSWAAGKFSGNSISEYIKENVEPKVKCRRLVIPGKVAVLKGDLEAKLPGWEIIVGPREAVQLVKFLKDLDA